MLSAIGWFCAVVLIAALAVVAPSVAGGTGVSTRIVIGLSGVLFVVTIALGNGLRHHGGDAVVVPALFVGAGVGLVGAVAALERIATADWAIPSTTKDRGWFPPRLFVWAVAFVVVAWLATWAFDVIWPPQDFVSSNLHA